MAERLKTIVDRVLTGLLGDAEHAEKGRPPLMLDMLSDWLPYRVFDPGSRLYFNARSKGFILSVTPLIGADERTGEILGAFFSEGLPPGACLQVLHLASPRISRIVAPWFAPRYVQGGVYEAIARHRAKRLYGLYLAHVASIEGLSGDAQVGAIVLFVLWVYYTAVVFLLGGVVAETWELRMMQQPGVQVEVFQVQQLALGIGREQLFQPRKLIGGQLAIAQSRQ